MDVISGHGSFSVRSCPILSTDIRNSHCSKQYRNRLTIAHKSSSLLLLNDLTLLLYANNIESLFESFNY